MKKYISEIKKELAIFESKTNDELENYCIKISTEGVNMIYMVA